MKILAAKSFIFISFYSLHVSVSMGIGFVGVGGSILVRGFLGGLIFANFIINTPVI